MERDEKNNEERVAIMLEYFKPLNFNNNYLISNYGNLINKSTGHKFEFSTDQFGYKFTNFGSTQNRKGKRIHRLVAEHFVTGYFDGAVVNHIDGNPSNNKADNLEWVTQARNIEHGLACDWLIVYPCGKKVQIYNLSKFCRENNLNAGHLSEVAAGKRKQHKGFQAIKLKEPCNG